MTKQLKFIQFSIRSEGFLNFILIRDFYFDDLYLNVFLISNYDDARRKFDKYTKHQMVFNKYTYALDEYELNIFLYI